MATLVIGATGNVGREVIRALKDINHDTIAAVGSLERSIAFPLEKTVLFDFATPATWEAALDNVDKVFLLRPPAISDVKKHIFPFIDMATEKGIKQIVFLSLQGVQFNPLTPHNKIERYIRKKKTPYTFLRPNFFMQNLTTFYKDDITKRDEIYLPAGMGKTAFIDVRNIGDIVARVLSEDGHLGKAYTLSGGESLDYYEVASILSAVTKRCITYKNPSTNKYVERLRRNKADKDFIMVQKMLYFVVRHNFSSSTTSSTAELLGRQPISFREFASDNAAAWRASTA